MQKLNLRLVIAVFMTFSFSSVSAMKWDSLTSFPYMAWIGPPVSTFNSQVLNDMKDAGLTVSLSWATMNTPPSRAQNLAALDSAHKYGMKLLICDDRWGWFGTGNTLPSDSAAFAMLDSIVDDYKDHPAYFGIKIQDEPSGSAFSILGKIKRRIIQRDPDHLVYINLADMPEADINKFIDTINPQVLSFDTYPITRNGCSANFYTILDKFRRVGLNRNLPVWAFAMTIKLDGWPLPTVGMISLQQYANLAYGAKGLECFTYANVIGSAPVENNGTRAPLYDVFKKVNSGLMRIAPLLKNMTSIGVSHSMPLPEDIAGFSSDSCIQYTTGNAVIAGWFKDSANTPYVLLVNRSHLLPGTTRLFTKQVTGFVEVSKQTGLELTSVIPEGNSIEFFFEPGEGRLFRIIKGTLTDVAKPGIAAVAAKPPNSVAVTFSERVNKSTAENIANYSMSDNIQILSASLESDSTTVVLSVSELIRDSNLTLQVSNVQDVATNVIQTTTRSLRWVSAVLDWSFDEGTGDTIVDVSGYGNHGFRYFEASYQDGKAGKAMNFSGGSVFGKPEMLTNIVNSFTMMLWVKPTQTRDSTAERNNSYYWGVRFPFTVTPYGGDMYGVNHVGAGLAIGTNGVSIVESDGDAPYPYHSPALLVYQTPITDWTHIAAVYDNKVTKLYVNGVLVRTGLTSIKTVHPSGQLGISYNGGVDEFKVFSYPLTASEIDSVIKNPSTENEVNVQPKSPFAMQALPMPFRSSVRIIMNQEVTPGSKLFVVGLDGKVVDDLSGMLGKKEIFWQSPKFSSGVYVLKLINGNKVYCSKITSVR